MPSELDLACRQWFEVDNEELIARENHVETSEVQTSNSDMLSVILSLLTESKRETQEFRREFQESQKEFQTEIVKLNQNTKKTNRKC